ncbi:MAG TPA: flagellar biosynthetic protein FliO [Pirellulales bacterium]|nr:flagellar biosynthetic protein FliO [Pirellulales bacterium]
MKSKHISGLRCVCVCSFAALAAMPEALIAEESRAPRQAARADVIDDTSVQPASFEKLSQSKGVKQPQPAAATNRGKPENIRKSGGVPLPPRGQAKTGAEGSSRLSRPVGTASTLVTGAASLALVLGLFFVVAWALRRGMPRGSMLLPGEVVEVLGRTPLTGRQFAHLVRCGNKLLLVHLATGCAETLTEITDPVEVDRLAGLCKQAQPQSTTASFRQVFQQFSREKSAAGRTASGGTLLSKLREHQPADTALEDIDG